MRLARGLCVRDHRKLDPHTFKTAMKLYHGTPNIDGVMRAGIVRASSAKETMPDVEAAVAAHRAWSSKVVARPRETYQEVAPEAHMRWMLSAQTPMKGYSYLTSSIVQARQYTRKHLGVRSGGVVEVVVEPNAEMVVDEDWLGCVGASLFSDCSDCDYAVVGNLREFEAWASMLTKILSERVRREIADALPYIRKEIDWDDYCALPMRAVLGRTIFRDLKWHGAGAVWLSKGLEFASAFAHLGPVLVYREVERVAPSGRRTRQ